MLLQHPNVAPLLGFAFDEEIAIISPWFTRGNISDYLNKRPQVDRGKLVGHFEFGSMTALMVCKSFKGSLMECYTCTPQPHSLYMETLSRSVLSLHALETSPNAHLQDNVLIDQWGNPRITDFGLSKLLETEPGLPSAWSTSLREAGNARWIAPELLLDENSSRSLKTDIFSFGCVAFFVSYA